jgi:hypothetical protein
MAVKSEWGDGQMRLHRRMAWESMIVVWMDGWMNDDDDVCKHECMIQLGDNISSKACLLLLLTDSRSLRKR